jgi:hypothetical protein
MGAAPFSRGNHQLATIQARAAALDRLDEEPPGLLGFPDGGIQFLHLGMDEDLPVPARRVALRQEGSNLGQGKPDVLQQRDQPQLVNGVRIVPAPPTDSRGGLEQTDFLVIPQG